MQKLYTDYNLIKIRTKTTTVTKSNYRELYKKLKLKQFPILKYH